MARNLAHRQGSRTDGPTRSTSTEDRKKELLNRRQYLQLGAVASAAVVGAGGLSSGVLAGAEDDGDIYRTDFSEYATVEGETNA